MSKVKRLARKRLRCRKRERGWSGFGESRERVAVEDLPRGKPRKRWKNNQLSDPRGGFFKSSEERIKKARLKEGRYRGQTILPGKGKDCQSGIGQSRRIKV